VKTAISLPDATFARIEDAAHRLGISRSEVFARAAERYLDELDEASITERLNAVLNLTGGTDDSNRDAAELGRAVLDSNDDQW
jgi:metal-responsive CopG/Arc/MetJ family transcriptional regulator